MTRVLIEDMADGTTDFVDVPVTAFAGTAAGAHGLHLCDAAPQTMAASSLLFVAKTGLCSMSCRLLQMLSARTEGV